MPKSASFYRRDLGPWIIVLMPMDDEDWLLPTKRCFYNSTKPTHPREVDNAEMFLDKQAAVSQANKFMHIARNVWAEVVPYAVAWTIKHGSQATWDHVVPKDTSETYYAKVQEYVQQIS